jgi:transposase InsO family protein
MLTFDDDIPPILKGAKYFMIITDNYSRYRWFYALKRKSDVVKRLEEWVTMIQTQFHKIPKRIRTDCGKEWLNKALSKFAIKKRIQWEPIAPYSQNQDGVAERSNRTIVSRGRIMLLAVPGLLKVL